MDAILRLKEHASSLELVHVIKKNGGCLRDSFLDEGFILEKRIGMLTKLGPLSLHVD